MSNMKALVFTRCGRRSQPDHRRSWAWLGEQHSGGRSCNEPSTSVVQGDSYCDSAATQLAEGVSVPAAGCQQVAGMADGAACTTPQAVDSPAERCGSCRRQCGVPACCMHGGQHALQCAFRQHIKCS